MSPADPINLLFPHSNDEAAEWVEQLADQPAGPHADLPHRLVEAVINLTLDKNQFNDWNDQITEDPDGHQVDRAEWEVLASKIHAGHEAIEAIVTEAGELKDVAHSEVALTLAAYVVAHSTLDRLLESTDPDDVEDQDVLRARMGASVMFDALETMAATAAWQFYIVGTDWAQMSPHTHITEADVDAPEPVVEVVSASSAPALV